MELGLWKLRVTLLMRCNIRKQRERGSYDEFTALTVLMRMTGRRETTKRNRMTWFREIPGGLASKIVYEYRCRADVRSRWDRARWAGGDRRTVTGSRRAVASPAIASEIRHRRRRGRARVRWTQEKSGTTRETSTRPGRDCRGQARGTRRDVRRPLTYALETADLGGRAYLHARASRGRFCATDGIA